MIIFFGMIVGAAVGAAIGSTRNNVGGGLFLGGLLGPIGWILVLFLDNRPKCPACKAPLNVGAIRCFHCGLDRSPAKPGVAQMNSRAQVGTTYASSASLEEKKCPFCAEPIKREAIKCRFCGSDLRENMKQAADSKSLEVQDSNAPKRVGTEVHFKCLTCGQPIAIEAESAGLECRCPECGEHIIVPSV